MALSYITILRVESVEGSSRLSRSHHDGQTVCSTIFLGKNIVPPHST